MKASIPAASLADRLADEVGPGRVVAALFSTFRFSREFFERVPLPLITAEGRRRGLLPITVVVDRTQFEGCGWGYEVVRAPGGRRWHSKLIAAMIEQESDRRTVIAIGSGNLTRSGWERNLELFHLDSWWGWRLPGAVLAFLRTPWLRGSAFARWARDVCLGTGRRHHQSVVGSIGEPLWHQLDFIGQGRRWSEFRVVSPFGDVDGDGPEAAGTCGPFFDHVLDHALPKGARMTVYLRGVDEAGTRAYGDPSLLKRVAKRVELRLRAVPPDGDRILHAKLLAIRAGGAARVGQRDGAGIRDARRKCRTRVRVPTRRPISPKRASAAVASDRTGWCRSTGVAGVESSLGMSRVGDVPAAQKENRPALEEGPRSIRLACPSRRSRF